MVRKKSIFCLICNIIVCLSICLPSYSQEEEARWSGLAWGISPAIKWDGISFDSNTNQWSEPDFLLGLESVYRMSPYAGIGASLFFSSNEDSAIEVGMDYRCYLPLLNDLLNPYIGLQLNYLTRKIGGFSIVLRPGIEIITIPNFALSAFGQIRYDIFESLERNLFQIDQFTLGSGLQAQYRF